jgi:hypothetical protein
VTFRSDMDAIKYFTRNKHSDYPEVVFSSILSNLLDPEVEICFKDELLRYLYDEMTTKGHYDKVKPFTVNSEHTLEDKGNVDIFIESGSDITAIEVKIWDRSAINNSINDEPQLVRYADVISEYGKEWRLIFVVPTLDSPICLREFKKAFDKYPNNIFLLSWNSGEHNETGPIAKHIFPESLLDILEILREKSLSDDISKWILASLIKRIPELVQEIPEQGKFPNGENLESMSPDLWPLFQLLFSHFEVWPNSNHTTIGIPYGKGKNKSRFKNNSVFRIRTTTQYYLKKEDINLYIPKRALELELWRDVFKQKEDEIIEFAGKRNIEIISGKHLDRNNKDVVIMSIPVFSSFNQDDVKELQRIIFAAFEEAAKKSSPE